MSENMAYDALLLQIVDSTSAKHLWGLLWEIVWGGLGNEEVDRRYTATHGTLKEILSCTVLNPVRLNATSNDGASPCPRWMGSDSKECPSDRPRRNRSSRTDIERVRVEYG